MSGLEEKRDARIKSLSGGQRRRLDLALALVGSPELLFLDEPTTGFDPAARRHSWEAIRGLAAGGTTIVLTTHYLEEAQELADRVIVMARGASHCSCGGRSGSPSLCGSSATSPVRESGAVVARTPGSQAEIET